MGTLEYGLNSELLAAYGALLDRLGDRYEAGKYLFLAGSTQPHHQDAIRVYLNRNQKAAANELVAQFPAVIRHQGLGNLPENVRSELEKRGIDKCELQRTEPRHDTVLPGSWRDTALTFSAIAFLMCSVVFWGVGALTCIRWVWSFF